MTPFVTAAGYVVLALTALTLQAVAMRSRRCGLRLHPAQTFLAATMHSTPGRWIVLALWTWAGWHFFVR